MGRPRLCCRQGPRKQPTAEQYSRELIGDITLCFPSGTATYHNCRGLHVKCDPARRIWLQLLQHWQRSALGDVKNGIRALSLCSHCSQNDGDEQEHRAPHGHLITPWCDSENLEQRGVNYTLVTAVTIAAVVACRTCVWHTQKL